MELNRPGVFSPKQRDTLRRHIMLAATNLQKELRSVGETNVQIIDRIRKETDEYTTFVSRHISMILGESSKNILAVASGEVVKGVDDSEAAIDLVWRVVNFTGYSWEDGTETEGILAGSLESLKTILIQMAEDQELSDDSEAFELYLEVLQYGQLNGGVVVGEDY